MNNDFIAVRETALKQMIFAAGKTALESFQNRTTGAYTLKGDQDFLTEADALVENQIRQAIQAQFPADQLLGEESGITQGDADHLWVIDPIDGTANFARGIEHFCIAIAYLHQGITELGAIYNPATQELYQARKDSYAKKNGRTIKVVHTESARSATVELGWSNRIPQARYIQTLEHLLNAGINVRRGASGAMALAWVAEGKTDGYAELHMNAWDCLAGLLLVREAGGSTGRYPETYQDIFNGGPVLAASPSLAALCSQASSIPLQQTRKSSPDNKEEGMQGQHIKVSFQHPPISLIEHNFPGWGVNIYISGSEGVTDLALLEKHGITTVINCAVNLDIDWVDYPAQNIAPHLLRHGGGPIRYYKLGLIDGEGNPPEMLYAGYHLMRAALLQKIPNKPSYRNPDHGNILINCRGGRSRSVSLVALFLHLECPQRYPTLEAAIAHVRKQRQLHPDEWFEAPKPIMISLAKHAIYMEQHLKHSTVESQAI